MDQLRASSSLWLCHYKGFLTDVGFLPWQCLGREKTTLSSL